MICGGQVVTFGSHPEHTADFFMDLTPYADDKGKAPFMTGLVSSISRVFCCWFFFFSVYTTVHNLISLLIL